MGDDLIGIDSLACSATTELSMYAQRQNKNKEETHDINVENPLWWEKPRQPTDCRIHYEEEITTMGAQGQRPLAPPLFATRSSYNKEATTSFSLSLSHALYNHSLQNINNLMKMCALSHIYTYMTFGLFTYMSIPIGRTDRNRILDHPVLSIFHPEGHVSQQHIHNNPIVCCSLINFRCSRLACCRMIL